MEVLVSEPEGKGPHLGLIVCQHILITHVGLGRDPSQIGIGERLAAAGYVVAIP
jgi:dienelactone hydrolase